MNTSELQRTRKEPTAIDVKYEAQRIAFSPLFFQAFVALRDLGILEFIYKQRNGVEISEVCKPLALSEYGVRVLLEAASVADVVEYLTPNKVKITKLGFFLLKDRMTHVNINFVNDVCYTGAKNLTESIKTGKPEGLKVFGNWKTVYAGLSQLPENVKKSWFEFDHYYSDGAFQTALEIVFQHPHKYLFDVGGNTGKWAFACCEYNPDVKVKILDLPGQLNLAIKNVNEKKLSDRIDFHEIDILDGAQKIPKGADAIWMSQFLDCFSENEIRLILKNARQASDNNTILYILEPFFDNQKYRASEHCLTGTSLYFTIIANGNSKMYSIHRMNELVKECGFEVMETFPLIGDSFHTILKCRKVT